MTPFERTDVNIMHGVCFFLGVLVMALIQIVAGERKD